ncbi:hypothetical protein I6F11_27645 [Ensifer sp. NBAIM29]|nr:hypothetical protein [Ensifer sp. NBAIM29]
MKSKRFIITAEIVDHSEDGLNPEDGSRVWKVLPLRKTWSVDPSQPIGEIMKKVNAVDARVYRVTITEDSSEAPW